MRLSNFSSDISTIKLSNKYSVNILQEKLYQKQTELFASENSNTRLKQKNSELTKIISDKKNSNSSRC